jgi:hypothetical protein
MKNLFCIMSLILSMSLLAHAGNEGAQAGPMPPQIVIAKVSIGGGFAPPSVPSSRVIEILNNGMVQQVYYYQNNVPKVMPLTELSQSVLKGLTAVLDRVQVGTLQDPNPVDPGCVDAPSTTYAVVRNGQTIAVAQRMNCKEYVKSPATQDDQTVKDTLDALLKISNLLH